MNKKSMRLLFVGDENVGKTTLISTIYSELTASIQRTHRRVILPPEMCLYSKEYFTELIDTAAQSDFKGQIQQADLVLLIYDISDPETIERIESVWLSRIQSIKPKVPVILVGNKLDVKEHEYESQHDYIKVKDILKKVSKRYRNVQMGIQCSAFYDRNVKSVLNCAQRAVLYPLSPLYDLEHKRISVDFQKALIRIFRILDKDLDGKIYDSEMNNLQERVFQSELNVQDLKAIKQTIIRQLKVDCHEYIELSGFLALQKKCIDMLKIQICWSILRYFNYNDNLRINVKNEHFQVGNLDTIQLTNETLDFLLKLYHLKKSECQNTQIEESMYMESQLVKKKTDLIGLIFASSPWIRLPEFEAEGDLSEQNFLLTWQLYAFIDYQKCYEDLLYLGYEKQIDETFFVKNKKKTLKNYEKLKQNKVYSVLIIQSKAYSTYVDSLFYDGQKISMNNGNFYMRNTFLYKGADFSKMFILFKVNKSDLDVFFNVDEETKQFSQRIDVLVDFQDEYGHVYNQDLFSQSILHRKIPKKEAEDELKALQPLQLDLESIPVVSHHSHHHKIFEIILESIQGYEKYLSQKYIEHLKKQQEKSNKLWAISATGITVGLMALGAVLAKNGALASIKLWSK